MATMNSLTDIWSVVMDSLSQELTQTAINTWFSDCTPIEINNNTLIVHTTSDFKRSIIQARFEKTICAKLYDLFSCPFELVVLAGDDELLEYREKRPSAEEMPEMDGYTFDRFIVGPSNKFAHAAAIVVQRVEGVEKLLLRALLAGQELDVVDQKHVRLAVALAELLHRCRLDGGDRLVREFLLYW